MITVSESLNKGIESFLKITPEVSGHLENSENPHAVTKTQVGLGNVKNEEQATKAEFQAHQENRENPHSVTKSQVGLGNLKNEEQATKAEFLAEQERVTAFMERQDNPHSVTKSQVGLENVKNEEQATKEEFLEEQARVTGHIENRENPHAVTKEQVGLGNLKNSEQATAVQFMEHVSGTADKHSGSDIMYSDTKSVNEKIDELIVEGGSGTMYHSELLERDNPDQHPISAISGLRSELDGLAENFNGISHTTLSGREEEGAHPISAISGLSEKLDEILVFEGITTDASETNLLSQTQSDFIVDGYFTLPNGYGADIEVSVLALRESEGGLHSTSCCGLFRAEDLAFRIGYMMPNGLTDFSLEDGLYQMTQRTVVGDGNGGNSYKCGLGFNGNHQRCITVTGAEGHRVFWRGIIRIKNILKVEAEA